MTPTMMETMKNVLDLPWIGVRYLDGRYEKVGLLQALVDAHSIAHVETGGESSDYAVLDLLLAVSSRNLDLAPGEGRKPIARSLDRADHYITRGLDTDGEISAHLEKFRDYFAADSFLQVDATEYDRVHDISRLALDVNASRSDESDPKRTGVFRTAADVANGGIAGIILDLVVHCRMDLASNGGSRDGSVFARLTKAPAIDAERKGKPAGTRWWVKDHISDKGKAPNPAKRPTGGTGIGSLSRIFFHGDSLAKTIVLNIPPQPKEVQEEDLLAWEFDSPNTLDNRWDVPIRGQADFLSYQHRSPKLVWDEARQNVIGVVLGASNFDVTQLNGARFWQIAPYLLWFKKVTAAKPATASRAAAPEKVEYGAQNIASGEKSLSPGFTSYFSAGESRGSETEPRNVSWCGDLVDGGVIGDDENLATSIYAVSYGKNASFHAGALSDTYISRGFLASVKGDDHRSAIAASLAMIEESLSIVSLFRKEVVSATRGRGVKLKGKDTKSNLSGVVAKLAHSLSTELHRKVADLRIDSEPERFVSDYRSHVVEQTLATLDQMQGSVPIPTLATTNVPTMMSRKIASKIGGVPMTQKPTLSKKKAGDDNRTPVERKVHSIIARAKRDASIRAEFARYAGRDPHTAPVAVALLGGWGEDLDSIDIQRAEIACVAALSVWAATSGAGRSSDGGLTLFSAVKSAGEGSTRAAAMSALQSDSLPRTLRFIDQLARIAANKGKGVNYGLLAEDIYNFQHDHNRVQMLWAREYSIGKASR